ARDAVWRPLRVWLLAALALYFGVTTAQLELADEVRVPLWSQELRHLGAEVEKLPPGKRLVFVPESPIECMFYARATCIAGEPTAEQVAEAQAGGFAIASYGESGIPGVTVIPFDPHAVPARRLAAALRQRVEKEVLVFNARDPAQLESYLGRSLKHADVSSELPAESRRLERKRSRGATLVVLLPPGTPAPQGLVAAFPDAVFLEDATYAR